MKRIIFLLIVLIQTASVAAQPDAEKLCKGISAGKFKKLERKVKRMIREIQESKEYSDTSAGNLTMEENLDALTEWFRGLSCVEDAFRDKCEIKIMIYPGWSVIGVKFRTGAGIKEKCFHIQCGTTGQTNILGWKLKTGRMKNKLVYGKMYDCAEFVKEQKAKCLGSKEMK